MKFKLKGLYDGKNSPFSGIDSEYNPAMSCMSARTDGYINVDHYHIPPLSVSILEDVENGENPRQIIKSLKRFPLYFGYFLNVMGIGFILWALMMAFRNDVFHPAISLIGL